jgi:hypothetical protein
MDVFSKLEDFFQAKRRAMEGNQETAIAECRYADAARHEAIIETCGDALNFVKCLRLEERALRRKQ